MILVTDNDLVWVLKCFKNFPSIFEKYHNICVVILFSHEIIAHFEEVSQEFGMSFLFAKRPYISHLLFEFLSLEGRD